MNPANFAIQRKTTILILTLVLLIGGTASFFKLGRLEDPEYTIKMAVVTTAYPGASPQEVEEEVTERLETEIQRLAQLKEVSSRSMRGLSIITVEIQDHYLADDLPQIWDELRRKVSAAQVYLPPGAGPPMVNDDYGDVYGIFFALTGEGYSPAEMKEYADLLKKELLLVPDVAKVELYGVRREAIHIEISSRRMSQLGISPSQIQGALLSKNLVADAGRVRVDDEYISLDPRGDVHSVEDIASMLIGDTASGGLIRLRDLAEVRRGYIDPPDHLLRIDGQPAVGLGVSIVTGGNVIRLGRSIKKRLAELETVTPLGVEMHTIAFQPDLVAGAVDGFLVNLAQAVVIVILVLMVFMGLRSGLIIGGVLLLTIASTLLIMDLQGIDLQRISLGALILALGMLVDNAIVVAEGILIKMSRGRKSEDAAAETVKQTGLPLLGATVVAVLAFAALGLSNNSAGEYTRSLFLVMLISLMVSWVLAVTVTPVLCLLFLKPKPVGPGGDPYQGVFYRAYRGILTACLRFRLITVVLLLALLGGAVYSFQFVEQNFFPTSTRPEFLVDYILPQGTDIHRTSADLAELEKYVGGLEGVESVATFIGQGSLRYYLALDVEFPDTSYGQLKVVVSDYRRIDALISDIRAKVRGNYPDATCLTKKFRLGPGASGRIRARFTGPGADELRSLAQQTMDIMAADPNAADIRHDWWERVKVLQPVIAKAQAERNAIMPADIAAALKWFVDGNTVGVFRDGDDLLPIIARPPEGERTSLAALESAQIWSPAARRMIPLRQVVLDIETRWEDPIIKRTDRKRTLEVICDPKVGTANALLAKLRPKIEALGLPPGYSLEWGGEFEDSAEANASVLGNVPLTTLLMFLIVVALFNKLRQPIIVFLCLPLSIIGVTFGLLAAGLPLGFMAILGALSLIGMLIKNSVVLIEEIDSQIKSGKSKLAAIIDASVSRFRPVTMAAITTVLGMTPLVMDAFYRSIAVTIMSGLSFATLLTLIVVPVLYAIFFRAPRRLEQSTG